MSASLPATRLGWTDMQLTRSASGPGLSAGVAAHKPGATRTTPSLSPPSATPSSPGSTGSTLPSTTGLGIPRRWCRPACPRRTGRSSSPGQAWSGTQPTAPLHHGGSALAPQVRHEGHDLVAGAFVEVAGGLVREENSRFLDQSARDRLSPS